MTGGSPGVKDSSARFWDRATGLIGRQASRVAPSGVISRGRMRSRESMSVDRGLKEEQLACLDQVARADEAAVAEAGLGRVKSWIKAG